MRKILALTVFVLLFSCKEATPPEPVLPIPSERQLAWHELGYYGFLHFNINTFTDMEWGTGGESPEIFNPVELDTRQWARIAKEAGMKGLIITAKHHDGFCIWPSKYTEHSVKNSPWKNGKGDVLKELAESCKEYGLKFGVYLSPWDRNHADYGTPEYVDYFHNQLRELLTEYGDIFEVWFDGANGGSGYYGGANETRKIDNKTYYEWDKVIEIVRELQPNAVIFGDGGPGVRWVGNEEGWANETNWSIIRRNEVYPGYAKYKELRSGHKDGTHWVPAECDVSIRPGWYYHQAEDSKVKTLEHLVKIYYESIGRNGSLLLNIPIDNRGLVHEKDEEQLLKLASQIKKDFSEDLMKNVTIEASNVRGNSSSFNTKKLIDNNSETYWTTDDAVAEATLTVKFDKPTAFNRLLLQEYIKLGQRVKSFSVEAEVDGVWKEIDKQTTIGYKRILRFDRITTKQFRIHILDSKDSPTISNLQIFNAPNLLTEPILNRNVNGELTINIPEKSVEVYYTLDGSTPNKSSKKYETPFLVETPTVVSTIAYDSETKTYSEVVSEYFDISKKDWKVVLQDKKQEENSLNAIDDNPHTSYSISNTSSKEIIIDLGNEYELKGFTYWPMQGRWMSGVISKYQFFVSSNGQNWKMVSEGEFGNIWNNPIEQKVNFEAIKGKFIKLKATGIAKNHDNVAFGEVGVITQ